MQSGYFLWQPWITLSGIQENPAYSIIQSQEHWLDGVGDPAITIYVDCLALTGCTLFVETSITPEGPWETVGDAITSPDSSGSGIVATDAVDYGQFSRYLRWKITTGNSGGTSWEACFRFKYKLGGR